MHFQQELMHITDSTVFKLSLTGACLNRADTLLWLKLMSVVPPRRELWNPSSSRNATSAGTNEELWIIGHVLYGISNMNTLQHCNFCHFYHLGVCFSQLHLCLPFMLWTPWMLDTPYETLGLWRWRICPCSRGSGRCSTPPCIQRLWKTWYSWCTHRLSLGRWLGTPLWVKCYITIVRTDGELQFSSCYRTCTPEQTQADQFVCQWMHKLILSNYWYYKKLERG